MRTSARRFAVLLFDEVHLLDFTAVLHAVSEAGRHWNWRPFKVSTVARTVGPVTTRDQLTVLARHDFDSCPPPEIVLVPGGYGARRAANDADVVRWLRHAGEAADYVLAIGSGTILAARAGLLDSVTVAARAETATLVREVSPTIQVDTNARTLDAGKIMTASTSASSLDLALELIDKTIGRKQAARVAEDLGYLWTPRPDARASTKVDIVEPEP